MSDGAHYALSGYQYQFDKTILELLRNPSKTVRIEQLQDLEIDNYFIQVKHHNSIYSDSQKKSLLKTPIIKLLKEFSAQERDNCLYIYFKGVSPVSRSISLSELLNILGKDGASFKHSVLKRFLKRFTLSYGIDFLSQNAETIREIRSVYCVDEDTAELYYALISGHLLELVTKIPLKNQNKRKTSKNKLDELINSKKRAVFRIAFAEHLGREKYFKLIRKRHFSKLNISPFERFFIIEADASDSLADLKRLVLLISKAWSNIDKKVSPKYFSPFLHFQGLPPTSLKRLKSELANEGHVFRDGHTFFQSDFNVSSLVEAPDKSNKIAFRFVNEESQLKACFAKLTSTKEIYHFFKKASPVEAEGILQIRVQIDELSNVSTIIAAGL